MTPNDLALLLVLLMNDANYELSDIEKLLPTLYEQTEWDTKESNG